MSPSSMISRYFDLMSEPLFSRQQDGRELYFPMGIYGRGRVVPDAATGAQLRSKVKWTYAAMFLFVIPTSIVSARFGVGLTTLLACLCVLPVMFWRLTSIGSTLERTSQRLTFAQAQRNQAARLSRTALWALAGLGVVMTAAAGWAALGAGQQEFTDPVSRGVMALFALLMAYSAFVSARSAVRKG